MSRSGPVTRDTSTVALGLAQIRLGQSAPNIATITPVLTADDSMGAMANTSYTGETEYWDLESGYPLGLDATFPLRESNMVECSFKEITPKNLALARGINPFADVSATFIEIGSVTTSGTTTGDITVDDDAGPTTETWTIVFTDATNYGAYGSVSGHVGDGVTTVLFEPDNSGNEYFHIPADYFSGTWAADETYVFATTAFLAGTTAYADNHAGSIALGNVSAPEFLRAEVVYTFPNPIYSFTIIMPRVNATSSLNIDLQAEDAAAVAMTLKAMNASSDVTGGNAVWDNLPAGQILFA